MIQQSSSTVCVSKIQLRVHTNENAHSNIAWSSTESVSTRVDKQIHISKKKSYTALNMNKLQLNLKTQLTLWSKECHCQEGTYGCVSWMVATQNCICCMYTHTHTFHSSVKYIRNRTMFNETSVSNKCLKQTVMAIFMQRLSRSLDNKPQQPSRDAFFHSSVSLLLGAVYIVYLTCSLG